MVSSKRVGSVGISLHPTELEKTQLCSAGEVGRRERDM